MFTTKAAFWVSKIDFSGTFGLNLTEALSLGSAADAATALGRIKSAISTAQTSYRSLYWDDMKVPVQTATNKTFLKGRVGVGSFDDLGQFDNLVVRGVQVSEK